MGERLGRDRLAVVVSVAARAYSRAGSIAVGIANGNRADWNRGEIIAAAVVFRTGRVRGLPGPVLLLPKGITERLTPAQLCSIVAHEMCHVRRRDNLATAGHMIVEAVFWFHPLVWWLGARLVEERERACDEEVVEAGRDAQTYAESISSRCVSSIWRRRWSA